MVGEGAVSPGLERAGWSSSQRMSKLDVQGFPRIRVWLAPRYLTGPCWETALIPRCRPSICVALRDFTAGVRPVIAGTENSFLSLAFIYALIKVPFTHTVVMAVSGCA